MPSLIAGLVALGLLMLFFYWLVKAPSDPAGGDSGGGKTKPEDPERRRAAEDKLLDTLERVKAKRRQAIADAVREDPRKATQALRSMMRRDGAPPMDEDPPTSS